MPGSDDTKNQNQQPTNVNSSGSEPTSTDPPPTPQAAPSPPAAPTQDPPKGKVVSLTHDRFAAMRKDERDKGQKILLNRLDTELIEIW